jgi:DNA (cytosine-5)-methyltransferase 1
MKILNAYAGIGGNRKLWDKPLQEKFGNDYQITAIELNPEIAAIYKDFFPNDEVIITDAHEYLLEHFKEYDFIWGSPPCPTHSRMENIHYGQGYDLRYPDMALYQEIILLKYRFKGKYCIENVISYYNPLIEPIKSNSHYYWTNFLIRKYKDESRMINTGFKNFKNAREIAIGFDLSKYDISKSLKEKVINNCVEPKTALHILNQALGIITQENTPQLKLNLNQ